MVCLQAAQAVSNLAGLMRIPSKRHRIVPLLLLRTTTPLLDAVRLSRHIEPVAVEGPLGCLFGPERIRPAKADYAGAHRDPESARLRFLAEPAAPMRPRLRLLKQCRRQGHQMGAGKPKTKGIRGGQLRVDVALDGVADTFGTYNKPLVPAGTRPPPLPPSDRPLALSRPAASPASGARGLPASAAPSVFRLAVWVVLGQEVGRSAVVAVERAIDPVMPGIGYLLPGRPRRASLGDGPSRIRCRECCHRVRYLSDRRTDSVRQTRSTRRI